MFIFNRVMVVTHRPPHTWEPYPVDDNITIDEINGARYAMLEFKDPDTGEFQYLDIAKHADLIDGSLTPAEFIPAYLTSRKPRMSMFIYDNLRDARLSYSLADVPGRHVHDCHDIVVAGCRDTDMYDRNTLFTIGGIIHRSHMSGPVSYIIDGGVTSQYRYNFGRIYLPDSKKWDEYDIDSTMLTTTGNYMDDCTLTLTRPPGPGEVPVFIIAGHIVPLGTWIKATSTDVYKIDLTNSPYISRMVDHDGIIASSVSVDDIIQVDTLKTNEHIAEVFDASQTFVVYVRGESTKSHIYPVSQTSIPGRYAVSKPPFLPMITGHGNIVDYVTSRECGWYMTYTNDERIKRYLASPEVNGVILGGIDPTDKLYRRTSWLALYVEIR